MARAVGAPAVGAVAGSAEQARLLWLRGPLWPGRGGLLGRGGLVWLISLLVGALGPVARVRLTSRGWICARGSGSIPGRRGARAVPGAVGV
ncbi:MAG: hypothetical protein ABR972_09940, partial [Acidimicrobiales bacterium]